MKIALFVDEGNGDWHSRRLAAAFTVRGVEVVTTTLKRCAFDTASPTGLAIPGFDGILPDGVFVRSISHGSLEQITFRLGILHALRESGIRVWNDARAIERCVDKSTATFLLAKAGLPVPATVTVEGEATARQTLATRQLPAVAKPLFGAQGVGLRLLCTMQDLPPPPEVGDVYYMQTYIPPQSTAGFQDWRVLVSAGRVVGAMTRRSDTWITNVAQGASPVAHTPCERMARLALDAAEALGADYAGVDLIADGDDLRVLEANSNPAWRGLQSTTRTDVAAALADDFLAALARGGRR